MVGPRRNWRLFGLVIASVLIGSGFLGAGDNVWTGGRPSGETHEPGFVVADPSNPHVVYAVYGPNYWEDGDVYRSGDGGRTWTRMASLDSAVGSTSVLSLMVSPASPSTLFATSWVWPTGDLFKSADGGATWSHPLSNSLPIAALAAHPAAPSTLYAGGYSQLFRSEDNGDSWDRLSGHEVLAGKISALLFDPEDNSTLYAAGGGDYDYPDYAILRLGKSTDAGATWTELGTAGMPVAAAAEALVLSPADPSTLFVGVRDVYPYPRPEGGVFRSSDGGATWARASVGMPEGTNVSDLVADPRRHGTLYAATDAGIFRTTDNGEIWLRFGRQLDGLEVRSLVLNGSTLHAATSAGVFELALREGAVDVSAGSGKTRLLSWNADRLSIRTLETTGDVRTPEEGPFGGWTATAVSDGPDGLSRVLWVHGDGRAGLEVVGPSGSQAAFRFPASQRWTATDLATASDGTVHILWTRVSGSMYVSTVDATGAVSRGNDYGPYPGWAAIAIADGPDGSTWALWRSMDGRSGLTRHQAGIVDTTFRFEASPDWAVEDVTVGADGRLRLLRTNPDGRAELSTVDSGGRLTAGQIHGHPGFEPRRIAAGPDGLTRLLWGSSDGRDAVWLLNADNALTSAAPAREP